MNAVNTFRVRVNKAHPNAASQRYFLNKLADSILSGAICVGIATILFFLITFL